MSQFIAIDLSSVKSGDEPLPTGPTDFVVESAILKKKESSQFPYIEVFLRPLKEELQGFRNPRVFLSLSPASAWHLKRFTDACQFKAPKEGFSDSDLEGKYIRATVVHDQGENGEIRVNVEPRYQQVK